MVALSGTPTVTHGGTSMAKKLNFNMTDAPTMVESILDKLAYFHSKKGPPTIPFIWTRGEGKLVLVLGDNAGGKSFFRRLVYSVCKQNGIECLDPSMEGRASGGIVSAMIYGDESYRSTGENSSHVILTGIRTCRGRTDPHCIFWDEPDIGLSEQWAAGAGQCIGEFVESLPELTFGVFVVTHSRALVRELLPLKPHYLHLGSTRAPDTVQGWLDRKVKPRRLEGLPKASIKRFRQINEIMNRK